MRKTRSLIELEGTARVLRRHVIEMLYLAGSGHTAGPLGLADFYAAMYFSVLNIRPDEPDWAERDVYILSNGHTVPILYAAMAEAGFFDKSELKNLRRLGSPLQGHPERLMLPGIETTSGPLGSGLSQAAGYAYSLQYFDGNPDRYVYTLMGDGELNEGNIWEAAMFAGKYKLGRLIGFIDRNNIQIDGSTNDVMPLEDLQAKWESFGWLVQNVDGHDIEAIIKAVAWAKQMPHDPNMIILHTTPGRGVNFMEHDYRWHGKVPNKKEMEQALSQLDGESNDHGVTHYGS